MEKGSTKKIVSGGISAALMILSLYLGSVLKGNRIALLVLAIYISVLPYIIGGIRSGILSYGASAVLALILIPNKPYAAVFAMTGIYPLIKLYAENKNTVVEFIIKFLWFNITVTVIYFIYRNLVYLNPFFIRPLGLVIVILAAQIFFIIYDFVFTRFIMFLQDRIKRL